MIRPRRVAHRGSVVAAGFVIDPALIGHAEARRRVLAVWATGARVYQLAGRLVVVGLRPVRVRVSAAAGAPLVEQHGVLAALPLEPDEHEALAPAPGTIVIAVDGVARVIALSTLPQVDVTTWVDLDGFEIVVGQPLAPPPERVTIPAASSTDVRALTGVASAPSEMKAVTTALIGALAGAQAGPAGAAPASGRLARWLAARLQRRAAGPSSSSTALARLTWLDRLRDRLAAALWNSRLGAALGRKHAAYLRRMIELFDRGELDEALRHAIPLGGGGDSARLRLGVPSPREALQLSLQAPGSGAVIPVADAAMGMMRERYRAAAARLEQAGRIDEAAFVLADLLVDAHAAIALLERHDRLALAARLAEARGLEAGLVVRLWFLAGDRERAIDTARRTGAWRDAIGRLERAKDPRGAVLRMLWADHLAQRGDYVQAVDVAWPIPTSRALVEAWIDRGISGEGPVAARLLVKKLTLAPGALDEILPNLLAMLEASGLEATRSRLALIDALVAAPTSAALRTIARPAARALIRDAAQEEPGTYTQTLKKLLRFSEDGALRADVPVIVGAPSRPALREPTRELRWAADDAGVVPVLDAAFSADGRIVLALGELGVRVLGRTGRIQAHLDQPASRLVISDHGTRALAVAPRGQVQRIARLDLVERRGAHWCDAELDDAASTFDGDLWLVTRGSQVCAIDTNAPRWRAVWGVDVDQPSCSVRREGAWFAIEAAHAQGGELWFYEGFTLRRRHAWQPIEALRVGALPSAQQWFALTEHGLRGADWSIDHEALAVVALDVHGAHLALGQLRAEGVVVTVSHYREARTFLRLHLDGAQRVALRLTDTELTAADDRGRVVVIDLQRGAIVRDLRIS